MNRLSNDVPLTVSSASLHFGARAFLRPQSSSPAAPNIFVPASQYNAIPEFSTLLTLEAVSGPAYTVQSLTAVSTLGTYLSNVYNTVIALVVIPAGPGALSMILNVPFRPQVLTNIDATTGETPLEVEATVQDNSVIITLPSAVEAPITIHFDAWALNDILPYDPKMSYEKVTLDVKPTQNVLSVTPNELCHATKQGSVIIVVASLAVEIANALGQSKFRIRIPSIPRALDPLKVVSSVQINTAVSPAIVVEDGDIYCTFTGNGAATSYTAGILIKLLP